MPVFSGRGGSWLGCQVLLAISAVSILELTANSGSSRMSQSPNLHRAMQLFKNGNESELRFYTKNE